MADDLGDNWWIGSANKKQRKEKKNLEKNVDKQSFAKKRKLEKKHGSKKEKKKRKIENFTPDNDGSDNDEEVANEQEVEDSQNDDETTEEKEISKDTVGSTKKKHSRRKITDELKGKVDLPLRPTDLNDLLHKHFGEKLTKVELEDLTLDDSHFAFCNDLSHNVTSFLKTLIPKWKKMKKEMNQVPGSPLLLILCSSALRAANFIRLIGNFKGDDCKVGKLFAKHFQIEDQMKFLKVSNIHIGVGTANRIQQLLESGALHLDQVKHVILDCSWRDIKQKRLFDIPEICRDTISLLSKFIIPRVKNSSVKLALL